MRRVLVAASAFLLAAGCGGVIAPPYTDSELQQRCARDGGWWRPDELRGGFCEFQSQGYI